MSARRPRILLTGASGQVGWELRRALAPLGEVVAPSRPEFDLAAPAALRQAVRALAPAVIVNPGAYTAVDAAEREPQAARAVNGVAPGVLAEEAARLGVPLVHFSTDYVFDGARGAPYTESDPTAPLGVYGATKLEGEQAVAAAGAAHVIVRTGWVYGARGRNFLLTMLRLGHERRELRVVDDQHGAPTWSRMLAEATAAVLARCATAGGFALPLGAGGIYHLTAAGETTWCRFARRIFELAGRDDVRVHGIATADYPTPARRPAYSVLAGERIATAFGVRLPDWETQLALCLDERPAAAGDGAAAAAGR